VIDLLLKAIDRVIDLARISEKRLRSRYEEIYKPSFQELQQVHMDYQKLISDVVARLLSLRDENFSNLERIRELHEHVRSQRLMLLPVRQKLKILDKILDDSKIQTPAIEVNFLRSIASYFEVSGITQSRNTSASSAILDRLELSLSARVQFPDGSPYMGKFVPAGLAPVDELIRFCEDFRSHADSQWANATAKFNILRVAYAESVS
jgi:hypothetical protein